ncbi:MAG: cysteine synthase A [Eubacterium sp.]|nr:cysteine synthase A [Eubacterium sp.]
MRIYDSVIDLIGNTPLVRLSSVDNSKLYAEVIAKLECFNPGGSAKDRPAYNMIKKAMEEGLIDKDTTIVEGTSGNTGIGLAHVASALGLKIILVIPDTMSIDKINHIKAMGATVVLTPGVFGMKKAFLEADKIASELPKAFIPSQITNINNPLAHELTTGEEIWSDTEGQIDFFVAGIGTGGTITGTGHLLKKKNPDIKIIGVEPAGSAVLSGEKKGPHKIQGIGAGFIPDILDRDLLDEVIKVEDQDALDTARALAKKQGIFAGISSGAATWVAMELAKRPENKDKKIVAFLPDTGERYLNTELYNPNIKNSFVN